MLAAGAPVAALAAGALAAGVGLTLGNTVWESTLQRNIPRASLSRVTAYDWFGALALRPLGLVVWGPLAAGLGLTPSLWLAFALQAALALAMLAMPLTRRGPA
jgi:hypothetical protein